MTPDPCVWVFHGNDGRFAGGVFRSRELGEQWILRNRLSGMLTAYPLDEGCYDWAMRNDLVTGRARERGDDPAFVGSFTCASQEHGHYTDGEAG